MSKKKVAGIIVSVLIIGFVTLNFVVNNIDWVGLEFREKYPNPSMTVDGDTCDMSQMVVGETSIGLGDVCDHSLPIKYPDANAEEKRNAEYAIEAECKAKGGEYSKNGCKFT